MNPAGTRAAKQKAGRSRPAVQVGFRPLGVSSASGGDWQAAERRGGGEGQAGQGRKETSRRGREGKSKPDRGGRRLRDERGRGTASRTGAEADVEGVMVPLRVRDE